jgi:hypothetical protein
MTCEVTPSFVKCCMSAGIASSWNSYSGCERCEDIGESILGCVRYTDMRARLRKDEEWELYDRPLLDNDGNRGEPREGDVHRRHSTPLDEYPIVTPVSSYLENRCL